MSQKFVGQLVGFTTCQPLLGYFNGEVNSRIMVSNYAVQKNLHFKHENISYLVAISIL